MMGVVRSDPDDEPVRPPHGEEEIGFGWGEAPEPAGIACRNGA